MLRLGLICGQNVGSASDVLTAITYGSIKYRSVPKCEKESFKREFHNIGFAKIKRLFAKNLRILSDFFAKPIDFVAVMR